MDAKELEKKIEKYEKLADKNYDFYQQSGDPKYDRAYEKYTELADVYRAAYKYQSEEDDALSRRLRNMGSYIKEHITDRNKENYTKEEVLRIAEDMKQFCF